MGMLPNYSLWWRWNDIHVSGFSQQGARVMLLKSPPASVTIHFLFSHWLKWDHRRSRAFFLSGFVGEREQEETIISFPKHVSVPACFVYTREEPFSPSVMGLGEQETFHIYYLGFWKWKKKGEAAGESRSIQWRGEWQREGVCAWIGDIYTAQSEWRESPQSHLLSTQLSLHSQAHPSARSHTTLPQPTLMERGKRKRRGESEKERDRKQLRERENDRTRGRERENKTISHAFTG